MPREHRLDGFAMSVRDAHEDQHSGATAQQLGHDRDASRPATDRDLAVPAGEIAADPGEALTAARIAEPAHTLDQRGLESGRVPPARPEALALRRLEGVAEPYPRVRHRDHDYPLRELAAPVVRLHRHPAAGARVLYNILTRL